MHYQDGRNHPPSRLVGPGHHPHHNFGLQFIPPDVSGLQPRLPGFPQSLPFGNNAQTRPPWISHPGLMSLPSTVLGLPSDQPRVHPRLNFHIMPNRPPSPQKSAVTNHNFLSFNSVRPSPAMNGSFAGFHTQQNSVFAESSNTTDLLGRSFEVTSDLGKGEFNAYRHSEEVAMEYEYDEELDGVSIDSWPNEPGQDWQIKEDRCENTHAQQIAEPDILRFGDRMPNSGNAASRNVEHSVWNAFGDGRGANSHNAVPHFSAHEPNLVQDGGQLKNRHDLDSVAQHIQHAVQEAVQHVADQRSARGNKENVRSLRQDEPRKRYLYEKPRKDENRRDTGKNSKKPVVKEKDTLENLLTKVKEGKDVNRKSRRSPSPRPYRRPNRSRSRERRGDSYSRRDRITNHNSDKPSEDHKASRSDRNKELKLVERREEPKDSNGGNSKKNRHEGKSSKDTKPKQSPPPKSVVVPKASLRKMSDASSAKGSEEGEIISIISTTTEPISRESTPYSPPGCLPGEEDQIVDVADISTAHPAKKSAQHPEERQSPVLIDLTTPVSPQEVSTLEKEVTRTEQGYVTASNAKKQETNSFVREVARSFSTTDYDKIDLGAPMSPDADYSVLYSPSTAPILLGDPDSPDPSEAGDQPHFDMGSDYHTLYTEQVLPFNNEVVGNTLDLNVDEELEAALEQAGRDGSSEDMEQKTENVNVHVQEESEVVIKEEDDLAAAEPAFFDVEADDEDVEENWPTDEELDEDDFDLPFFPFDVTLHANESATGNVMFGSEDVLRARAMAAFGTQFRTEEEDDSDMPPPNPPVKDVLRVEMDVTKENAGLSSAAAPLSFVSFNFGSLLPPGGRVPAPNLPNVPVTVTAQSPPRSSLNLDPVQSPIKIKQESPVAVIPLSPSPCREGVSNSSAIDSGPLIKTSVSGSSRSSSVTGDKGSESSAQQSFFRRMMNQAENTTQITFEASKPRIIESPARVAEQKKAHRLAKFGPMETVAARSYQNEPASDEPDAPAAPPTKFTTGESSSQAPVQSANGKMMVPMPTPKSAKTAGKKGSSRKKRKRLQASAAVPVIEAPEASNVSKVSGAVVLPERRTIPSLHALADHDHQSSIAHREAYKQLDALECSLEEAYWNDIEIIDKIRKLESELKLAHRKKMKSDNHIGTLHELVDKAAHVIAPENADEIMDVVNHPPSEDSSVSSSRAGSPDCSSRPRKRSRLNCPSYLRLPSWTVNKEKDSKGNLDVHEDPFLRIIRQLKTIGDEDVRSTLPDDEATTATGVPEGLTLDLLAWRNPGEHAELKALLQSAGLFQLRAGFASMWTDDPCGLAYVNSVIPTKTYCFCDSTQNCKRAAKHHLKDFPHSETRPKLKEQFTWLSEWIGGEDLLSSPVIAAILAKVRKCQSRENSSQLRELWLELLSHIAKGFEQISSEKLTKSIEKV